MAQDKQALIDYLKLQKEQGKLNREQIEQLQKLEKQQRRVQKASEDTADAVNDFKRGLDDVGEAFGLRLSDVFDVVEIEVQQAKRDIATMFDDLEANAPDIAATIAKEFNTSFREAIPSAEEMEDGKLEDLISNFKAMIPEMGNELEKAFASGDIANFYKQFGDEGMKTVQNFLKDKKGFGGLRAWFAPGGEGEVRAVAFRKQLESFEPAAQKTTKVVANWGNMFRQIGDNILNYIGFGKIIQNLLDFDNKLSNIKREFQIPTASFGKASAAMSGLVKYGAQFGLDNEKAFKLVKDIGEYAKTTNIQALAATAKQVAAVSDATGIALETVGQLTGQMMFFGANAEKARGAFTSIMKSSSRFGLNVTAVAKQFQNVFPRFARMGFKAGEESLARMAAKAEKMGTDINKLLDASDKFLDINAALEASADLSLLGGAAAQTSFTDLMKAAQDGPEAMDKLMNQMTSDIGKLNKDGRLQLTMIDRQRINAIAQASGEDVESVTNRINSRLQDAAKKAAIPPGVFNSLSDEEKDFLLSKVTNVGGKWKFEGLGGITDLKNVSKDNIQAMMNKANSDAKNIESAAKSRQSLEEKLTNLANEILAQFTAFQPYLEMLKHALDSLRSYFVKFGNLITDVFGAKYGSWVKTMLLLGGILMLTFGPSAMLGFGKILFSLFAAPVQLLSGLTTKMGAIFKGGGAASKKITEKIAESAPTPSTDIGKQARTKTPPSFLQQFSKISPAQILSVAAALLALGAALMMIGKGIEFAANGFANLVRAFNETKNAGMALAAVGIVMGGFIAMLYLLIPAVGTLAAVGTAGAIGLLALGASLMMVGAGIFLAAKGFSILIPSIILMGNNIGSLFKGAAGMIALGVALGIMSPFLIVFGVASLIAVPGMIALGFLLKSLALAKGVNPGILKEIAKSMGSIAWGLTKLGLVAPFAALAIISAGALMIVALALKNLSVVDVKKVQIFGDSLSGISLSMIKGLAKLGLISPFAVLAMVSAGSIWLVSKALANITPIDLKKLENFGDSMGMVGEKMIKGLIKLGLVSPFAVLGLVSAGGIWLISKALANITPIDMKKLENFGDSMGMVGIKMMAGLIKLGLISPFVVLGVVAAGGIWLISRMLKNIPLIDMKTLNSNAAALNSVGITYVIAFGKFNLVAALTPLAIVAAGGIWLVSKLLKNVPQLSAKTLTQAANVVNEVSVPFLKAFGWLQPVAGLTPLAVLAGMGILGVTKSLSAVPKLNPEFLKITALVLNEVSGPFAKALGKLALVGAFTPLALFAALGINKIADILSKITPLNSATLISVATTLSIISTGFSKGLLVLGLLGVLAAPAIFAAFAISKITNILTKVPLLDSKKLTSVSQTIANTSGGFLKGLAAFAVIGVLAIPAAFAAIALEVVVKTLTRIPMLNPTKLITTANTLSAISTPFLKGLAVLALTSIPAIGANVAAIAILSVTKMLSMVPMLNPAKLITTANVISTIALPFVKGLGLLALASVPAIVALASATAILGVTKILSAVPMLNPTKLITTANVISTIALPFVKGLGLLALASVPAIVALASATAILGTTKILSAVPMLNPVKLITTANVISQIALPFVKGLGLLALASVPAIASLASATAILGVTKILLAVPMLNPAKLITTANVISAIAMPFVKGLGLLALASVPAIVALASATAILGTTKILSAVPMLNPAKLITTANVISTIALPFVKGLGLLALASVPAIGALASAIAILGVTKILLAVPMLNPTKLVTTAQTIGSIGMPFAKGLGLLALALPPSLFAMGASINILGITKILLAVPMLNPVKLITTANVISQIALPFVKGLGLLALASVPAIVALASATAILGVTKILLAVPMLNPAKLITTASVISTIALPFVKGLGLLALASVPAIVALASATAILGTTKILSAVPMLNPAKLITTANVISTISLPFVKGLGFLALASVPAIGALASAIAILGVTKILLAVPMLNPTKLVTTAQTIGSIGMPFAKGLGLLALALPPSLFAMGASINILGITKILLAVPMLNPAKLITTASVISTIALPFVKGLGLLALASVPAIAALGSATAILGVTKILLAVPMLNPAKLITTAKVISTIALPFVKGLGLLALASVPAIVALATATAILGTTKILSAVPMLNPAKLITTANVISNIALPFVKGLGLLALASAPAIVALATATAILGTTKILSVVPMLNKANLVTTAQTISVISYPFLKGLSILGLVAAPAMLAMISAGMILGITKILNSVPMLNPVNLVVSANVIKNVSMPFLKGLAILGLVAAPATLALLSSVMILGITKILSSVPILSPIKLITSANTIYKISWPFVKGLGLLALAAAPAMLALISATAILGTTKILSAVPMLSPAKLITTAQTISKISWPFLKGLGLLALAALPATIALATATAILGTTKILSAVPMLNPTKLITTAQTISAISYPFLKGLAILGLVAAPATLALISSGMILGITKILNLVPMLNPVNLIQTADVINKVSSPFFKGLLLLGIVAGPATAALVSATMILGVTKILNLVPMLNPANLIVTANTINTVSKSFLKGLIYLGLVAVPSVLALISATMILGVSKILSVVPMLNPAKLIVTANTINNIAKPFLKGLAILGLASVPAVASLVAASSILGVTKILNSVPMLNPTRLITTAEVIKKISWPFLKGLATLALVSGAALLSIVAASAILGTTKILTSVPMLDPTKLTTTAMTIASISKPLLKGFSSLALVAAPAMLSVISASLIYKVTKILTSIPAINPALLLVTATVIEKIAEPFSRGLNKFSAISSVAFRSIISAYSLLKVIKILSEIPQLSPSKLMVNALVISQTSSQYSSGLNSFSSISKYAFSAIIAAMSLNKVVKLLFDMPILSPVKFIFIANILNSTSKPMADGLSKLSKITDFAGSAVIASLALKKTIQILTEIPNLSPTKFVTISMILNNMSGPIVKGMIKFSQLSSYALDSYIAGQGLKKTAEILKETPFLLPIKFKLLADSLSYSGAIAKGLSKLAGLTEYTISGRIAASNLDSVVTTLSKIPVLSSAKFRNIIETLNLSPQIYSGIGKLSKITSLSDAGTGSANTLKKIVKILDETKILNLSKFLSIVTVLNLSGQIVSGLSSFSKIQSYGDNALDSAKLLSSISRTLSGIKNINPPTFKLIVDALAMSGQIVSGLNSFSKMQSYADKSKESANLLSSLSRTLSGVKNLNPAIFKSIVDALALSNQIVSGLSVFSKMQSYTDKSKDSASLLSSISRTLTGVKNLNPAVFKSMVDALNLSGNILNGLTNFAKIQTLGDKSKESASTLANVSNKLTGVKNLNPAVFRSIVDALNLSGQIVNGLNVFSKIQSLGDRSKESASLLANISNKLVGVKNINPQIFKSMADALNLSGQIVNGLINFSKIQSYGEKSKESASLLANISNKLIGVKNLNLSIFGSIVNALNLSNNILSGLLAFSKIQTYGEKSKESAGLLANISNKLTGVKNINPAVFKSMVDALNLSGNIVNGLIVFSKIQSFADSSKESANVLASISNKLTGVKNLNPTIFKSMVDALSLSGQIIIGLKSFSNIHVFGDSSKESASVLTSISNKLTGVKNLNPTIFKSVVDALNLSGQIVIGLKSFSKIQTLADNSKESATVLANISNKLTGVKNLNSTVFKSVSDALNFSGKIFVGLREFSKFQTFEDKSKKSANLLAAISKTLSGVKNLNATLFKSMVDSLNFSNRLFLGLVFFSKIQSLEDKSKKSANLLATISKTLSGVKNLSPAIFKSIVDVLSFSTQLNNSLSGFVKLNKYQDSGPDSAKTLLKIVKNLGSLKSLDIPVFESIIKALNFSGQLTNSLASFVLINKFEDSGPNSANTLKKVVKTLGDLKNLNSSVFQSIVNALNFSSQIYNSLTGFSKINDFEESGPASANTLRKTVKNLSDVKNLNPNTFQLIVTSLAYSKSIVDGLSLLKNLTDNKQAVDASKSLRKVSEILSEVANVAPEKFVSLSQTLAKSPVLVSGLKSLSNLFSFTDSATSSAKAIRKISDILSGVVEVPQGIIVNLANTLAMISAPISNGLNQINQLENIIKPSTNVLKGLQNIFKSLSTISGFNLTNLNQNIPLLGTLANPIIQFSEVGKVSASLTKASQGLISLGKGLQSSTPGFIDFATISWSTISGATPVLNYLMTNLIQFGIQGRTAAPGITAMANSMNKLGKSMEGVASGFGVSTKSMAAYNNEKDKLKTVARVPKPAVNTNVASLKENVNRSTTVTADAGKTAKTEIVGRQAPQQPQVVQIKPIEINLKLDGRMIQKLIVDANYNRS